MSLIQGVGVALSAMAAAWFYDYDPMYCYLVGMEMVGVYIYCDVSEKEHVFQIDGYLVNEA